MNVTRARGGELANVSFASLASVIFLSSKDFPRWKTELECAHNNVSRRVNSETFQHGEDVRHDLTMLPAGHG